MKIFNDDPQTEAVVMVGEIGGTRRGRSGALGQGEHEEAGGRVHRGCRRRRRASAWGTPGAIISGGKGTAAEKLAVMEECGIKVTRNPAEMGKLMKSVLK